MTEVEVAGKDPARQRAASTQAGRVEAERMRRVRELSKTLSKAIWDATRGLLVILGGSVPFAFGLALTSLNRVPLWPIIMALVAVVVGALCHWLVQVMTESRTRSADRVATQRGAAYLLLFALLVCQIVSVPTAAFLQGLAVSQTLQETGMRRTLDAELVRRINLYAESPKAISIVQKYCDGHIADNEASDVFLSTCVRFNHTPPPTPKEARTLIPTLRRDIASD